MILTGVTALAPSELYVFVVAALVLLVIPGPAVLFIVARSVEHGWKAGIVSSLGMTAGGLFHTLLAVLGLSAILAASAVAFGIVKYAGAAYLIYLGVNKLREAGGLAREPSRTNGNLAQIFRQAVIVEVFNPKAVLFFLSFLPQFVHPSGGNVSVQLFTLGLLFVMMALVTDSVYALIAGLLGQIGAPSVRAITTRRWAVGATYITLGVAAGLSGSGKK